MKKILIFVILLSATSCATQNRSMALGGTIGAGTGAAIGGVVDSSGKYRTRNVLIGSTIGALAGVFAGNALYENNEKQKQKAYEEGQKNAQAHFSKQGTAPELKKAQVESRWVEGHAVGNKYIDGHFEYVIIEPARWEVE